MIEPSLGYKTLSLFSSLSQARGWRALECESVVFSDCWLSNKMVSRLNSRCLSMCWVAQILSHQGASYRPHIFLSPSSPSFEVSFHANTISCYFRTEAVGWGSWEGEQASLSNLVLTSFCQERLGGVQSGMVVGIFLSWGKKSLVTAYRGPGSRGVASVSCRNPISILWAPTDLLRDGQQWEMGVWSFRTPEPQLNFPKTVSL